MARLTLDEIKADREYSNDGILPFGPDDNAYILLGHFDAEAATRKLDEWSSPSPYVVFEVRRRWVLADTHAEDCEFADDPEEQEFMGSDCGCLHDYDDFCPPFGLRDATGDTPGAFAVTEAYTIASDAFDGIIDDEADHSWIARYVGDVCQCAGQCRYRHSGGACGSRGALTAAPADLSLSVVKRLWAVDELMAWCSPCRSAGEAQIREAPAAQVLDAAAAQVR